MTKEEIKSHRKRFIESYNVMSSPKYQKEKFEFDLQLFGKGKSTGKVLFTIAGAFVGGYFPSFFGASSVFSGAIMGAALFSSLWTATHPNSDKSKASVTRFDREQEQMTSNGPIPLVYGTRMIAGNQTYHKTDADANTLFKHVVLCEGPIDSVQQVTANGLTISGGCAGDRICSIRNKKYSGCSVSKSGKTLTLNWNGNSKSLYLCNNDDAEGIGSFYSWQTSVAGLIAYINRIGDGWEAFPLATTSTQPGDVRVSTISDSERAAYEKDHTNVILDGPGTYYLCASHVTGETWTKFHNCEPPTNYEEVGSYAGMAWMEAKFSVSEELGGNPSMEFLVKGKKVYDPRTGKTEYSSNPALCLRDFLLNKVYGCGDFISPEDIDNESVKDVADYCDVIIDYPQADGSVVHDKRFSLNLNIDSRRNSWDWTQDILSSFTGFLTVDSGKIYFNVERVMPASYHFSERNINELKISMVDLEDTPNRYKVSFVDPLNNWKSSTAVVDDFADQKERGKIIENEVSLEGVTSQNQALRLARFYRDYNSLCSMNVSFKSGYEAMHLQCGDVVLVDYKEIFKDFPIRISEMKETQDGEYEITGRQYNDSIYNDTLGASLQVYNYAKAGVIIGNIPDILNLSLGQNFYRDSAGNTHCEVTGSWTAPEYSFMKSYDVYKSHDKKTWELAAKTSATSFSADAVIGDGLYIKVIVENNNGSTSSGVIDYIDITGIDSPPKPVEGLLFEMLGDDVKLSWKKNAEKDLKGYKVTHNGKNYFTSDNQLYFTPVEGDNSFSVSAVDYAGNESSKTTIVKSLSLVPSKPLSFSAINGGQYIILSWGNSDRASFYTLSGNAAAKIYGNQYLIPLSSTGTYSFTLVAENSFGASDKATVTINVSELKTRQNIYQANLMKSVTSLTNVDKVEIPGSTAEAYDHISLTKDRHLVLPFMFKQGQDFSIDMVFSTKDTGSNLTDWRGSYIIGKRSPYGWCVVLSQGKIGYFSDIRDSFLHPTPVNDGNKHRVTLVSSSKGLWFYLDGTLIHSSEGDDSRAYDYFYPTIGGNYDVKDDNCIQMDLYDLRVWSRSIAKDEIGKQIGREDGLLGYYKCDSFQDSSGQGHDLAPIGNFSDYGVVPFPTQMDTRGTWGVTDFSVTTPSSTPSYAFNYKTDQSCQGMNNGDYLAVYHIRKCLYQHVFLHSGGYLGRTGDLQWSNDGNSWVTCGSWVSDGWFANVKNTEETSPHSYWRFLVKEQSPVHPNDLVNIKFAYVRATVPTEFILVKNIN